MAHALKLISGRAIIAYALTVGLIVMFLTNNEHIELYVSIYIPVVSFLFGTKQGDEK